ncbi:synaptonemal complex protein 3 isoform X2 [Melanotaenia boesemani]|uniref:synaptonemal complex protein 3 isoform X2 n=1 Tax=Melanotaenia boesemani TaxID=1250792 RepID=UPI001C054E95|nr:synaptonemal complex protein 3 isoform X2 [Melanotaenia boesemani]
MASGRRQLKKKHLEEKPDKKVFDFTQEDDKKELSASEDEAREDETPVVEKVAKKRPAADFEEEGVPCGVGNEVQSMLEKFGADISKVMQAKKKRLECLTKNYMRGSQQKLEQLWNNYHGQRKKMTHQYSQQVSSALQQWELEAQRAEEQEEKLNNLFRQQQKILQQARVVQNQKLKTVRELYEQFVKNMDDMEKSHDMFLQGAQQELRKEMATLQKKILMDTQEMATVRKSLQSMLF